MHIFNINMTSIMYHWFKVPLKQILITDLRSISLPDSNFYPLVKCRLHAVFDNFCLLLTTKNRRQCHTLVTRFANMQYMQILAIYIYTYTSLPGHGITARVAYTHTVAS